MIEFLLDGRSGAPPYRQLVQQVKDALRLGRLTPGDQLPTIREVAAQLVINPNTVLKAYRELELAGLIGVKPGLGTFVLDDLPRPSVVGHAVLARDLMRWVNSARDAGLDDEDIAALISATLRGSLSEEKTA